MKLAGGSVDVTASFSSHKFRNKASKTGAGKKSAKKMEENRGAGKYGIKFSCI